MPKKAKPLTLFEVRPLPADDADDDLLWAAVDAAGFICRTKEVAERWVNEDYRAMLDNCGSRPEETAPLEWTELPDGGWMVEPVGDEALMWAWVVRPVTIVEE